MINIDELIIYRELDNDDVLRSIAKAVNAVRDGSVDSHYDEIQSLVYDALGRLVELAGKYGFQGNLWHDYLTMLLVCSENTFSRACECRGIEDGSLKRFAIHDFMVFRELFRVDVCDISFVCDASVLEMMSDYHRAEGSGYAFNKRIRDCICELSVRLAGSRSIDEFADNVIDFYKRFGVGKLGLHKAFRIENGEIIPITNIAHVRLDDLVGYENAKKQLTDNTEAFLCGRRANNCLLYGEAGTGKSSSIKAILNRYYEDGLRIIEVYRHQFRDINSVIAQIKDRNYRFILYMDDLSFEEFETEYKYLKAVIEGGLERKPQNVLIYATSNRRHLVKENFSDRDGYSGDVHKTDTMQEKLSLAARFGLEIYFGAPDKKQFDNIVCELARRDGLDISEDELLLLAHRWELRHGGFSGRTARQFIDDLLGKRK
ncbi:MAG: ATP-binding protein [Clostridia bacterium]|nr:ATP-binding protein [Clostridia bacterium]